MFCDFPVQGSYNVSELYECLRRPGILPDYSTQFLATIREYFEKNIFVDYYRSPPAFQSSLQYDPFDFFLEIDQIEADYRDGKITTFDVYMEIQRSVIKLRDGHVHVFSPCLINFYYVLPFEYEVLTIDGSKPYFRITSSTSNLVITHLTLNGGLEDMVEPYVAFSDWALKFDNSGYSPHARFNSALKKLAVTGSLNVGNMPLQDPSTVSFTAAAFTYQDGKFVINVETEKNYTLEWLVVFTSAAQGLDVENLDTLCPLQDTLSVPVNTSIDSASSTPAQSLELVPSSLHNISDISSSSPIQSPEKTADFHPPPRTIASLSAKERIILEDSLRRLDEYKHTLPGAHLRSHTHAHTHTQPHQAPYSLPVTASRKHADAKAEAKCSFEQEYEADSAEMNELCVDDENKLAMYAIPALRTALLRISTFQPEDDDMFGEDLDGFIEFFSLHNLTDLIIDIRGNGGGSDLTTGFAMGSLFPDTIIIDQETSVITPGFAKDYLTGLHAANSINFYKYNTETIVDDFYSNGVPQTFRYLNGTEYTRVLTPRLMASSFPLPRPSPALPLYMNLTPEHIYVVSDGLCYSNCAVFAKKIRDLRSARVIAYSYNPAYGSPEQGPLTDYALGSVPSIVMTTESIQSLKSEPANYDYFNNFTNFPPIPPIVGVSLGFSFSAEYSLNPNRRNELMYFTADSYDDLIPKFSHKDYQTSSAIDELIRYIHTRYIATGVCFAGEVLADAGCTTAESQEKHAWYGHPCVNSTFDFNRCVFARCLPRYFLSGVESCTPTPFYIGPAPPPPPPPSPEGPGNEVAKRSSGRVVVVIVVVVVLVVIVAVVVMVGVVVYRRKKRTRRDGKERAPSLIDGYRKGEGEDEG